MLASLGNRFLFDVSNWTNWAIAGTSITPGNNTFPAYVEILSDTVVTQDCYAITIFCNSGGSATAARDTLVNIGADPAGGTSFTTLISNLSVATTASLGTGIRYTFPLFIKSGTSLAAQASINNATVGTIRVGVRLYGQPTRPEVLKCGSYIDTFGAVTATSTGTAITPGATNAEGTFVQLGSNTTRPAWWWQIGLGINNTAITSGAYLCDLAAGSSTSVNDIIVKDQMHSTINNEAHSNSQDLPTYYADVPSGTGIFGRASFSTAVDTGISMIAYGLGG